MVPKDQISKIWHRGSDWVGGMPCSWEAGSSRGRVWASFKSNAWNQSKYPLCVWFYLSTALWVACRQIELRMTLSFRRFDFTGFVVGRFQETQQLIFPLGKTIVMLICLPAPYNLKSNLLWASTTLDCQSTWQGSYQFEHPHIGCQQSKRLISRLGWCCVKPLHGQGSDFSLKC